MRETADEGERQRHPGRGRDKVLDGESGHLHEIAHRALAAVVLPVGVGDEAGCGIEGEVGGDRRHALRVERQRALQPLQRIKQDQAREVEQQHGDGVGQPMLLDVGVNAGESV
jgi:hypothetical protein